MRVFVAWLLCFVVALQGGVSAHALSNPCPMEQGMGQAVSADGDVLAADDCCNDAETAAKTGQPCKADMPCNPFGAFAVPPVHARIFPAPVSGPAPAPAAPAASSDASDVWRPPSAV
jgi:hypothetical protein